MAKLQPRPGASLAPEQMRQRMLFHRHIRQFFQDRDYQEWQTPLIVPMPGTEANLQYFACPWQDTAGKRKPFYLRSSPEIHLKKVLATCDVSRIFEIGPCFRNGGELGPWHHPEFTMLEWYRVGASYSSLMEETLALAEFLGSQRQSSIDFAAVPVLSVEEAFHAFAGLELIDGDGELSAKAAAKGLLSVSPKDDFETAFFKILIEKVEPSLSAWPAIILCDYPPSQAALAAVETAEVDGKKRQVARRFELYVRGVEIANGFLELQGAEANRQRIEEAHDQRAKQNLPVPEVDTEFLTDLNGGLPACCGIALGVDRLQAVLQGHTNLDNVIGFRRGFGPQPGEL